MVILVAHWYSGTKERFWLGFCEYMSFEFRIRLSDFTAKSPNPFPVLGPDPYGPGRNRPHTGQTGLKDPAGPPITMQRYTGCNQAG
jgi:hypothetical protein